MILAERPRRIPYRYRVSHVPWWWKKRRVLVRRRLPKWFIGALRSKRRWEQYWYGSLLGYIGRLPKPIAERISRQILARVPKAGV